MTSRNPSFNASLSQSLGRVIARVLRARGLRLAANKTPIKKLGLGVWRVRTQGWQAPASAPESDRWITYTATGWRVHAAESMATMILDSGLGLKWDA